MKPINPESLQQSLNNLPKRGTNIIRKELCSRNFKLHTLGDICVYKYFETGLYIAERTYPDVIFKVFKSEEEAVNFALDRFNPQFKILI
jgi:hypothetical protein